MTIPTSDSYNVSSGKSVYGGLVAPAINPFKTIQLLSTDQYTASPSPDQPVILMLHGSGAAEVPYGDHWLVTTDYSQIPDAPWHFVTSETSGNINLQPHDIQARNAGTMETYWLGWTMDAVSPLHLYTEHLLDAMMEWFDQTYPNASKTKRVATGGSMGGWGSTSYAAHRPDKFAAILSSRPRLRHNDTGTGITIPNWETGLGTPYLIADAPVIAETGQSSADYLDIISLVSNPANKLPFYGWCVGRQDGYTLFQDHIDMVAAMRATQRGFAFAWNDGNHSDGDILAAQILNSYTYGMFEIGVGYPVLSNCSADQDPSVDLVGGINLGFKWQNVVETETGWSCELTNILSDVTVTVKPKSEIFTANVVEQNVSIQQNVWLPVSFTV